MTADWTTAWATVAIALTGIAALIYASRQLKQSRQIEKIKHLLEFVREFESEPMAGYRKTVADERLAGTAYPLEAQKLLDFFETIGLIVRRGYVDAEDVWSSFGYWMFNIYADFKDDIEQEQRDDGSYYQDSCELLEILRRIEKKEGGKSDRPSKEEIREFWQDEANAKVGAPLRKRKASKKKPKAGGEKAIMPPKVF
jgi:hypothetical protein